MEGKNQSRKAGSASGERGRLSEEVMDTTKSFATKLSGVSRRDFMRISGRYGLMATYAAVAGMGGVFSAESLAREANTSYQKRYAAKPKHTLRLGAFHRYDHTLVQRVSLWDFAADLEERTEGAVRVEILGGNSICSEQVCIQKTLQGVLDIGASASQNATSICPWLNALDFPYMFQSRGQMYHFLFNPDSDRLIRKVYREKYRLEMLFCLAELRQFFMGLTWRDTPEITSVTQLAGTKARVTNTQLGKIAMQLMGLNPVPIAWVEVLDAMKSGLIDGMETWPTAITAFNVTPVVSHYVGVNFLSGIEHTAIRTQTLDKLGSALAEQLYESAYVAQIATMYSNEAGLLAISGEVPDPPPGTIFGDNDVKMNFFSDAALKEAQEMADPANPAFDEWHEKLNGMAGFNVYEEMLPVARQYPKDARAIDVEPRRWWQA